jgi:hypothetical protein
MNRLRPLEHWGRGFEFHSRHGCLYAFILCIGRGLHSIPLLHMASVKCMCMSIRCQRPSTDHSV